MSDNQTTERVPVSSDSRLPIFAVAAIVLWVLFEFALRRGVAPLLTDPLGTGLGADMVSIAIGFPLIAAGIAWAGIHVGITPSDWKYGLSFRTVGTGFAGFLAYTVLYVAAVAIYTSLLGLQPSITPTVLGVGDAPMWAAALLLVINGVVVPITEELTWRGVIQTAFMDAYGTSIAIVMTATAFVLKHLVVDLSAPPLRVTSLVILAVILCGLRARYGTTSSTIAHLAANGIATATLVLG